MNEARNNRYNLLTDYCIKNNILHLFIAHHKDDNLETFLSRKIAGSDFYGLKSMSKLSLYNRVNIIRPLLNFSKEMLLDYNKKNKIDTSVLLGELLAKRAIEKKINKVYFDRGGNKYHGRVKIFAETLRENGMKF